MASAWEPLVLFWFAALQILVAVWWWRGPAIPRMRIAVTALFALNGAATMLTSAGHFAPAIALDAARVADRWTDLFLLAVCLAGIPQRFLPRALHATLLAAAAAFLLLSQLGDLNARWGDENVGEAVLV
ncbi:MAG TPA: hypothetical protein VM582_02380, partial [Candidatus Thermoplasmatota archaeon]|nr:hypothetical protein [Candidatus Thermoplasmatota archaeon]